MDDFAGFYLATKDAVFHAVLAAGGRRADAEDAVAEAYTRAYARWPVPAPRQSAQSNVESCHRFLLATGKPHLTTDEYEIVRQALDQGPRHSCKVA